MLPSHEAGPSQTEWCGSASRARSGASIPPRWSSWPAIEGGIGRVGGITASDDAVWVRRAGLPLTRIDAATNEITDELDLGMPTGGDVLVAHGGLWTTAYDKAAVVPAQPPLTLASPVRSRAYLTSFTVAPCTVALRAVPSKYQASDS